MAGDWLMIDHELPDKEEVAGIFEQTGVEIGAICGRLTLLWIHADKMTVDGVMPGFGIRAVGAKFGGDAQFWKAVESVGWIEFTDNGCRVPGFTERFGTSARKRKLDARRKQSERGTESGRVRDTERTDDGHHERTASGHEADVQADARGTPEPRTENRYLNTPGAGAFSKLRKTDDLKDTSKVLSIFAADCPESDKLRILGAAERAIERGRKPVGMFIRIVERQHWHLITGPQEDRAAKRLKAWQARAGPPTANAASVAASLQAPTE